MGVTKKHRIQFYGGTVVDVCMILHACGLKLQDIRFERTVLQQGTVRFELYVDDDVKKYLDVLQKKSLTVDTKETV